MNYKESTALVSERAESIKEAQKALTEVLELIPHLEEWDKKTINKRFYDARGLNTTNEYGTTFTHFELYHAQSYEAYRGEFSIYLARNWSVWCASRNTVDVLAGARKAHEDIYNYIQKLEKETDAINAIDEQVVHDEIVAVFNKYFTADNYALWDKIREDYKLHGYSLKDNV